MPTVITGMTTGVCGRSNVAYNINSVAGASSYTWSVPAGVTITSGQGTTAIVVNFANTFTSGNICVSARNSCGGSAAKCLAVSNKPVINGTIAGPTTVCSKQTNVTYSIPMAAGAVSYTWTVPSQSTIISGQGTNSIKVRFGTKGGIISVKANNSCGSSNTSSLQVGLGSCAATMNQASSNVMEANDRQSIGVEALPNPTTTYFTLQIRSSSNRAVSLRMVDAVGRVVEDRGGIAANSSLHIGHSYRPGVYYAQVIQGGKMVTVKLIKQAY
jgi:hypothetical protein